MIEYDNEVDWNNNITTDHNITNCIIWVLDPIDKARQQVNKRIEFLENQLRIAESEVKCKSVNGRRKRDEAARKRNNNEDNRKVKKLRIRTKSRRKRGNEINEFSREGGV